MAWQPSKLTREQMAERRREGGRLLRAGKLSQTEIARELGVSDAAVSHWKKQLAAAGRKGLAATVSTGRPKKLNRTQRRQLLRLLKRGARAAGFDTERWTQARIQQVIAREFQVQYHPLYISRLLKVLGWSVQKPEPHPQEQDPAAVAAWQHQGWANLKKKRAA